MEISDSSMGIFWLGKVLGLAPYSVRKNPKGVYIIEESKPFLIYASTFTLIMVLLTYWGLLFDANSNTPIRMKSATSKVVTGFDVSVVVFAVVAGYGCGVVGLKATKELNSKLQKADQTLHSYNTMKWEKLKKRTLLGLPMLCICVMLILDISTWFKDAQSMKTDDIDINSNVRWYIPFYGLYLVLTALHVLFANTALCLGRRFRFLNHMLRGTFLPAEPTKKSQKKKPEIITVKISTILSNEQEPDLKTTLHGALSNLDSEDFKKSGTNKSLLLKLLAECHESLGKCVRIVSRAYGMTALFIIISCFLHLVATAYFLFIGLLSKKDDDYVWLQILWIIFHSLRLMMVTEPCHRISMEATKTIHIICEIERAVKDPLLAEEVKKFWQQLLVFDSRFTACGLCLVNRNLLTSLCTAIATYLVILIQFQRTNG